MDRFISLELLADSDLVQIVVLGLSGAAGGLAGGVSGYALGCRE
jgi:hypothetical protein